MKNTFRNLPSVKISEINSIESRKDHLRRFSTFEYFFSDFLIREPRIFLPSCSGLGGDFRKDVWNWCPVYDELIPECDPLPTGKMKSPAEMSREIGLRIFHSGATGKFGFSGSVSSFIRR